MAAADALVGEGLSISPWKEALAELETAKARIAELTAENEGLRECLREAIACLKLGNHSGYLV